MNSTNFFNDVIKRISSAMLFIIIATSLFSLHTAAYAQTSNPGALPPIISLLFDNDGDSSPENMNFAELVIGQWERTSEIINGEISSSNCATDFKVTFNIDGTYGESPLTGNSCAQTGRSGTYSVNGSEIEIILAFGAPTLEIITLNTNNLVTRQTSSAGNIIERSYSKL